MSAPLKVCLSAWWIACLNGPAAVWGEGTAETPPDASLKAEKTTVPAGLPSPPGGDIPPPPEFIPPPPEFIPPPPPKETPSIEERDKKLEELQLLERFLNLPPDKLTQIRLTIEKIEKMDPAEREQLRENIRKFRLMGPARRQDVRRHLKAIPAHERALMRQYWLELSPEEARAEREKRREMNGRERYEYYENLLAELRAKTAGGKAARAAASSGEPSPPAGESKPRPETAPRKAPAK